MPDERFIHPGEGESDKLTQLSDFEHRVWIAYKLAANDVGVMLDSPAPVQTINRNLRNRPSKDVRKALDAMLRLELLIRFRHGGEHYVCSPLWQDWQLVKYPRETHLPLPDDAVRALCSDVTQKLFELLDSKRKAKREKLLKDSEPLGNISKSSEAAFESFVAVEESSLHARAGNANANADATNFEVRGESERGLALSPGQLRSSAPALVSMWNARAVDPFVRVSDKLQPQSTARVEAALKAHPDLAWWDARFGDVTASTFCRGGGDRGWVADFWWVLENAELIASGRYRDRAVVPKTKVQTVTQDALARVLARREMPS
jgi:hypothetical protein